MAEAKTAARSRMRVPMPLGRAHGCMALVGMWLAGCAATSTAPKLDYPNNPVAVACASAARGNLPARPAGDAEQALDRVVVTAAPEDAGVLLSRGWIKSREGERDATVALFDLAMTRADADTPIDRIHWSYGWAMFNLKDYACALAHFDEARKAAPDQVRWLPQTFAVTYWQMGDHDAAVRWYEVAARNEPGCWIDARAAERCSRRWLRPERRALGELLTAWKRQRVGQAPSETEASSVRPTNQVGESKFDAPANAPGVQ